MNFLQFFSKFSSEFSSPSRAWTKFRANFFFPAFSAYLILFWLKIIPERGFLIFWIFCNFFRNFLRNFLPRPDCKRNLGLKVFSLFFILSHPDLARNNVEKRFFNFLNFFAILFSEFSSPGRIWTEFRTKSFFLFLGLSHSVLAINNARMRFFQFFWYCFRNFLPRAEYERNSGLKVFSLFFSLSHPDLASNNAKKWFFNFLNFFAIISEFSLEFSSPGWVWTELGTKSLFPLS